MVLLDVLLAFLHLGSTTVVDSLHAHILLTTTKLRGIDSDEQRLYPTFLSVLDISPGDFPITIDVSENKDQQLASLPAALDKPGITIARRAVDRVGLHRRFRRRSKKQELESIWYFNQREAEFGCKAYIRTI